jgi:4'-phosphopantetheinyl transferase
VWLADLDGSSGAECLSEEERARAERFVTPELRQRWSAGREFLRRALAAYAGCEPAALSFVYGASGKPALKDGAVRFNLSHCGPVALLAVTADMDIGVDVELVRPVPEMEHIARRFFAPEEAAALLRLPEIEREQAFFACWTRKEAFVKCLGEGLSHPLDSFEVSMTAAEPARLIRTAHADLAGYYLEALTPKAGYAAAFATSGRPAIVRTFTWTG